MWGIGFKRFVVFILILHFIKLETNKLTTEIVYTKYKFLIVSSVGWSLKFLIKLIINTVHNIFLSYDHRLVLNKLIFHAYLNLLNV